MTRPDWCDPLVWEASEVKVKAALEWLPYQARNYTAALTRMFAETAMTERDRCAKYATDQAEREPYGHCKATAYLIADNITGAK